VIIFAANTVVRFIFASLTQPPTGGTATCDQYASAGYSCRKTGATAAEAKAEAINLGCLMGQNACPGLYYCCSVDAPLPTAPSGQTGGTTPAATVPAK